MKSHFLKLGTEMVSDEKGNPVGFKRGIREYRRRQHRDDHPAAIASLKRLLQSANDMLRSIGEKTAEQIVESIGDQSRPEFYRKLDFALNSWATDLADRHPPLTAEHTAAMFCANYEMLRFSHLFPFNGNDATRSDVTIAAAAQFAESWHWWHLEEFGEHAGAYRDLRATGGRRKGTANRANKMQRRYELLIREIEHEWRHFPQKAGNIGYFAKLRFRHWNAALEEAGLPTFETVDACAVAITRAIRARDKRALNNFSDTA